MTPALEYRVRWLDHILRMAHSRIIKKLKETNNRGFPKRQWRYSMLGDVRQLGHKRSHVQDRDSGAGQGPLLSQ